MTPSPAFPAGCNAALSLTFDVDAETGVLMPKPAGWRDAMAMTHQAFGPKVGVPRILRILAEERVKATFFVPGWTARRYPELIGSILSEGHEVGAHSDLQIGVNALLGVACRFAGQACVVTNAGEESLQHQEDKLALAGREFVERALGAAQTHRDFRHAEVGESVAQHPLLEGVEQFRAALAGRFALSGWE